MSDQILESLFLDHQLWVEAVEHGVGKQLPQWVLESFQDPHFRADLCRQIAYGDYEIGAPHTAYVPKDDGGERVIFVNEPQDRLLLHVICKWLMRNVPAMVHPACHSYQEGEGIGRIVRNFSAHVCRNSQLLPDEEGIVGRKFDIHKYFDSVSRASIHRAFDAVEQLWGQSSVIDLLRRYYDSDVYYDSRQHQLLTAYNGLKQGCAVSAWLANVILYDLDEAVAGREGLYVRYSDDIVYVGADYEEVTSLVNDHLSKLGLSLNERKIEPITSSRFVRFLGYNVRGQEMTLSAKWVKHFQHEIDRRTIKNTSLIRKVRSIRQQGGKSMEQQLRRILERASRRVARYLYHGDGHFAWADHVLGIVNRQSDLQQLNLYCMDALRAVFTGKTRIGALGVSLTQGILRSKGRHVAANRRDTAQLSREGSFAGWLEGYLSMSAMNSIRHNKWLYRTMIATLIDPQKHMLYPGGSGSEGVDAVEEMENRYSQFRDSQPDGEACGRFYALPIEEMTTATLLRGGNRAAAKEQLEHWITERIDFASLANAPQDWYWQSSRYPELVLLSKWFK